MKTADATILHLLRSASQPLPLPELAQAAGLSPAELAGRMAGLEQAGFGIELIPHLGYRLRETPDRLIADDLAALLGPGDRRIGREIVVFEETGSTNDVVARMARDGAGEGLVVFAERQTGGRGRLGRAWASAAHLGLWFSVLLRPRFPLTQWPRLTTWAAVAIARAIEKALPGSRAAIKWPNDIYLRGRKAVGILIEGSGAGDERFAIVGIGVNVNHLEDDFPPEVAARAGSLRTSLRGNAPPDEPLPPLDRPAIAATLLDELDRLYPSLEERFPEILAEAEQRSLLLGKWVRATTPGGMVEGIAEGLESDGRLRLRGREGQTLVFSGGEEVTLS
ncbi:MAG TPA: biotin--[acetyl-CoA-carboxylase] ligase [Chthoniobacteraceae bacterium]|nr:biotin--[acetyl-CoA-carboxylase] ligase [Chthoniobacteraceae bacterium]